MHRRNQFFSNILKKQLDIFPYGILLMCGFLTIASLIGCLFRVIGLPESNIVVVYLLAVLLTALWTRGYILGIAASVAATLAFNYFFTVPIFTLAVHDLHYLVTFGIMSISALIITTLTSRIKRISAEAQQKEEEITVLYHLTSQL